MSLIKTMILQLIVVYCLSTEVQNVQVRASSTNYAYNQTRKQSSTTSLITTTLQNQSQSISRHLNALNKQHKRNDKHSQLSDLTFDLGRSKQHSLRRRQEGNSYKHNLLTGSAYTQLMSPYNQFYLNNNVNSPHNG